MHVDIVYAANLKPGDELAGFVVLDAPTRPVQPIAAALTLTEVTREKIEGRTVVYMKAGESVLTSVPGITQAMVIRGALRVPRKQAPVFTWNNSYEDLEQVAAWLPEFNAVYAAITATGGYPYNDLFKGKIPGLADGPEDTAIYLLQGLRRQRETDARIAGWLAEGYRPLTELDKVTKFPAVILYRSDRSGVFHAYADARLVPETKPRQAEATGKISVLIPKGKRTHGVLVGVNSFAVLVKN